jgi:hypothetical protein
MDYRNPSFRLVGIVAALRVTRLPAQVTRSCTNGQTDATN